jgi:hypothetical protein
LRVPSPHEVYRERLGRHQEEARFLGERERRLSVSRLVVFVLGVAVAFLALDRALFSRWFIALPVLLFVALVVGHDRAIRARRRLERAVAFYGDGLARLEHSWAGRGRDGERFADPLHPYAGDLDLFGPGSLFELLCTARTQAGEETLAGWLLAPAAAADIHTRHAAVDELRPRLDLREEIALLGEDIRGALDSALLLRWAEAPPGPTGALLRAGAIALPAATLLSFASWATMLTNGLPFLVAVAAQLTFAARLRPRVLRTVGAAQHPAQDLALLAAMLARFERESFSAPRLVELRAALEIAGEPPSARIARLQRLIDLLDAYRNQFFSPIGAILLWRTNFALAIERWRAASAAAVPRWLAAIGELEALSALASHAYESPADPFPEIAGGAPFLDGEGLGHPLIPGDRCVRNDVRLGEPVRVLVVSGSNMSGKSTLLRTVGVNTVLALAGAPVRARRLRLTPLAVGASIRIVDSLQDGTSRFYAEVKRLGRIVEIGRGSPPLLFLLDEILSGTNSHDRAIGAEAVVRRLVEAGALGFVTTHDLALARIADGLGERAGNVHFEDHLEDGHMVFDYRMRPGVVRKSNALALMRAVGLEV